MKLIYEYWRKITGKFTLIVLILILTAAAILLHERNSIRRTWREEQIRNAEENVRLQAATLDHTAQLLEETILNLSIDNSLFDEFSSFQNLQSYDALRLVVRIRNHFSSLSTVFPFLEATYVYYPEKDYFLNHALNPQISAQIRSLIKEGKETSNLWMTMESGEKKYLVLLYQKSNYCIGAWASYDALLGYILQGDSQGTDSYLADSQGLPLTALSGEALPEEPSLETRQRKDRVWITSFCLHPGVYLLQSLSKEELLPAGHPLQSPFLLLLPLGLLWVAFVSLCIYRWVLSPIQNLSGGIEIVSRGDISYRLPLRPHDSLEFLRIQKEFNHMLDRLQDLKIQFYEQELEHKETKLRHLGQQVQPHFILNALNTLYTCTERDMKETQQIILLLSRYFRFVVNVESRYVPLGQELEHLENYLSLQKVRFPSSLFYQLEVDPRTHSAPIPPFLLENFIGNCIKYGQNQEGKTRIHLKTSLLPQDGIEILIWDEGNGFPDEVLEAIEEFQETGEKIPLLGIGIYNCCERLSLLYGNNASIHFDNIVPQGARVSIRIEGKELPVSA